jgi:hypothetical protein
MDSEMEDSESLLATIAEETAEEMPEDQQVIDSNEREIETNEEKIDSKEDVVDDEPPTSDNVVPTSKNFLAESSLKLTQIPLARIKHIMKMDSDVNMASQVG